jgi:transcriptional regulator with XRE-family HTH domain
MIDALNDVHADSVVKLYYKNKQNFTKHELYAYAMNDEAKNLARNLRRLMEFFKANQKEVAKKAGVSQKTISNMLNPGEQKSPQLSVIEKVASAFGVKTWHLLIPNCPDELLFNHSIEKLVENYILNDDKGRKATLSVSEVRAQYFEEQKTLTSNAN